MEVLMIRSRRIPKDIGLIEDITSTPEAMKPGSLEWFRARAPLPLVLQAFFDNRAQLGCHDKEIDKARCQKESEGMLKTAKVLTDAFADFLDDPNAKAIAARLRGLTG
jgi:hypothetical protein